ncbi:GDP-mannose 4,6-dehydratase [Candidatus Pacearchaeota archaeon]|nr:GDP-mannose 4,6-dehydratase [Candidatus Pacearchaeota archaeon]
MDKKAFVTGITGQDGSYLAELLLEKGYEVHGLIRRGSHFNTWRLDHIYKDPHEKGRRLILHYGDLSDSTGLIPLLHQIKPDEIYNLAAQSHVKVSFDIPEYTSNADALGVLRVLEALRMLHITHKTKFYQASTSELFGNAPEFPQHENTLFQPRSPYAAAKLYGHWITKNYREAYGMFTCSGILFNHESPRRGQTFVTRKITVALSKIKLGKQDVLYLGNLDGKRDWGYAKDFVYAMWLMMQQEKPDDYVIATGESHSVREFVEETAKCLDMEIEWKGEGINEVGIDKKTGKEIIKVDPKYFRPTEVFHLQGDYSKAKKAFGWEPKVKFKELVKLMVNSDFERVKKDKLLY